MTTEPLYEPIPDIYLAARGYRGPRGAREDMRWAAERWVEQTGTQLKEVIEQGIAIWNRAKPAELSQSFFAVTLPIDAVKVLSEDWWKLRKAGLHEPLAAELMLDQLQQVYAQQVALYEEQVGLQGEVVDQEGMSVQPPAAPMEPDPSRLPWAWWPRVLAMRRWVAPRLAQEFRSALKAHPEVWDQQIVAAVMGGQ